MKKLWVMAMAMVLYGETNGMVSDNPITFINRTNKDFKVKVSMRGMFDKPTGPDLVGTVPAATTRKEGAKNFGIGVYNYGGPIPLLNYFQIIIGGITIQINADDLIWDQEALDKAKTNRSCDLVKYLDKNNTKYVYDTIVFQKNGIIDFYTSCTGYIPSGI